MNSKIHLSKKHYKFTTVYICMARRGGLGTPFWHNRNQSITPWVPSHQNVQETLPPTPRDQVTVSGWAKSTEPRMIREYCPLYGTNPTIEHFLCSDLKWKSHYFLLCGWQPPYPTQQMPVYKWRPMWLLQRLVSLTLPGMHLPWVTYAHFYITGKSFA